MTSAIISSVTTEVAKLPKIIWIANLRCPHGLRRRRRVDRTERLTDSLTTRMPMKDNRQRRSAYQVGPHYQECVLEQPVYPSMKTKRAMSCAASGQQRIQSLVVCHQRETVVTVETDFRYTDDALVLTHPSIILCLSIPHTT